MKLELKGALVESWEGNWVGLTYVKKEKKKREREKRHKEQPEKKYKHLFKEFFKVEFF